MINTEKKNKEKKSSEAPQKGPGEILVKMRMNDEKNEWNFRAKGPIDAIVQGRKICKDNGFRFPQDVMVWEFS